MSEKLSSIEVLWNCLIQSSTKRPAFSLSAAGPTTIRLSAPFALVLQSNSLNLTSEYGRFLNLTSGAAMSPRCISKNLYSLSLIYASCLKKIPVLSVCKASLIDNSCTYNCITSLDKFWPRGRDIRSNIPSMFWRCSSSSCLSR